MGADDVGQLGQREVMVIVLISSFMLPNSLGSIFP